MKTCAKMDAFLTVCVILGSFGIHKASGLLHCIECTHIIWDSADRMAHWEQAGQNNDYTWIQTLDQMFAQRFSPACASEDPMSWSPSNDAALQQSGASYPNIVPISDAVCPAFTNTERCTYMHGDLLVFITQYSKTIKLKMFLRNCRLTRDQDLEDRCYEQHIQDSYSELTTTFQDALVFIGPGTRVTRFDGFHCLCSFDNCAVYTQGSTSATISILTLLGAIVVNYIFRQNV